MDSTTKTTIRLAGRTFDLACLPIKKLRVVVPAAWTAYLAIEKAKGDSEKKIDAVPLRPTDMDWMFLAIFEALEFVSPGLKREDFDNLTTDLVECIVALRAVAFQTGVIVVDSARPVEAGSPGEA